MLLNKIKDDMWAAKKSKETLKANLLNTLYAEAAKVGKDDSNRESTDAEVFATIKKFLKGINETLDAYAKQPLKDPSDNKNDSYYTNLAKLKDEEEILLSYVPKQLTNEELLQVLVKYRNNRLNAGGNRPSIGEYMKVLKDDYSGQYDGKVASDLIKTL